MKKLLLSQPFVTKKDNPVLLRYAVCLVAVGTASISRLLLSPIVGESAPFLLFTPAIMVSAWYGGFWYGMLATILSVIAGDYFFIEPFNAFNILTARKGILILLLFLIGAFISWFSELLHQQRRRIEDIVLQLQESEKKIRASKKKAIQSQQQLQAIIDGSTAAIYIKDLKGRYIMANLKCEDLLHTTREHILGKTDYNFFPKDIAAKLQLHDKKVLADKKAYEWEETTPDGKHFRTSLSIKFPLFDIQGKPYGICGVSTDITDRKELEQRKDDFISMASHELKTPVTSLKVYTQILRELLENEKNVKTTKFLVKIDQQIDKLTRLIRDLLDVSKIAAGKLTIHKEVFTISDLVSDIVESFQETTKKHKLLFNTNTSATVLGDRDRIGQVLINFITNAIKYSPDGKDIITTVIQKDNIITVSVRDFGKGIDKKQQSKIFDRFYQVSDPTEKTFPGLGMGLYISNKIIKQHESAIVVESDKEKGSTFSFQLPVMNYMNMQERTDGNFLTQLL